MNADLTGLSFSPLGDRALLLELGGAAGAAPVTQIRAIAAFLSEQSLAGVLDLVPSLNTLGIHYDPEAWRDANGKQSPYEQLVQKIQDALTGLATFAFTLCVL